MKKTITVSKDKEIFRVLSITSIIFSFLGVLISIIGIILFNKISVDNLLQVEGTIENISYDGDEDNYIIELKENDILYKIEEFSKKSYDVNSLVKINDKVVIEYQNWQEDHYMVPVYYLYKDGEIIIDLYDVHKYNNEFVIYMGMVCIGIGVVCSIIFYLIYRKEKILEFDAIEYSISSQFYENIPFKNTYKSKTNTRMKKLYISLGIFGISFSILSGFLGLLLDQFEKYKWLVLMSYFIVFILGLVLIFINTPIFLMNRKKKEFIKDYKNYLLDSDEYKNEYNPFTDKGLTFYDYDFDEKTNKEVEIEYNIPYEDLNLYLILSVRKSFNYVSIFICTDLDENKYFNDYDYTIPLNNTIYKYLKSKEIKIRGLDDLLNNLDEESNKDDLIKIRKCKFKIYK